MSQTQKRIQKYIATPIKFEGTLTQKPIFISDSKGNYLRKYSYLIEDLGYSIHFICRGGVRFLDQFFWLKNNLSRKVSQYGKIVLYIWLGTCDLTVKKREIIYDSHLKRNVRKQFIELRHNTDIAAVTYIQDQILKYVFFVSNYSNVNLIFLEIPPYSIEAYNKYLGNKDAASYHPSDLILENYSG